MYKIISLIFLLSVSLSSSFGQANSTPIGKITYWHETNLISNNELNGDALLYFNDQHSVYIHTAANPESYIEEDGMTIDVIAGDKEGFPIYKNLRTKSMVFRTTMGAGKKNCTIKDKTPEISWQILEERKDFNGLMCQKAVGKYAGRVYEAWFTVDIPISSGPYKLTGLPGLIIEAKSLDGRVQFIFKEIELSENGFSDFHIKEPKQKLHFNSIEEFDKTEAQQYLDLQKKMRSQGVELSINPPHPDSKIEKVL